MEKKLKRMQIIRWISIAPFILTLIIALYYGLVGTTFIYNEVHGFDAMMLVLVLYGTCFWPVYVIALIGIIITSIFIRRIRKTSVEKPVETVEN